MLFSGTFLFALAASAAAFPSFELSNKRSPQFWGGAGSGSNTANDVTNKAACKAITVIFARGTGESGNIGSVIGPPLLKALQSKVGAGKVAYQGVPYAASAAVRSLHDIFIHHRLAYILHRAMLSKAVTVAL